MAALMFNTPYAFKQGKYHNTIDASGNPWSGAGEDIGTKRATSYAPPDGYEIIAEQGASMNFDQATDVAYGAAGSFNFKSGVTGTIIFDDATFGDPLNGYYKAGYRKKAVTASATPAVTSTTTVGKAQDLLKKYWIPLAVVAAAVAYMLLRKKKA